MLTSEPNFTFVEGDIMSTADVSECIHRYQIDTIIHLAAQTNVDASFNNPLAFAAANIQGTQIMLGAAQSCGVKRFIQMSSGEVYGSTKPYLDGHREDECLAPMNPYGAGKAAAEMLVIAAANSSELQVNIVRASNMYGPNQFPDSEYSFSQQATADEHY